MDAATCHIKWKHWTPISELLELLCDNSEFRILLASLEETYSNAAYDPELGLTLNEFACLMSKKCSLPDQAVTDYFSLLDRDFNGFVSKSEFVSGCLSFSPSLPSLGLEWLPRETLRVLTLMRRQWIFMYYDADRDGILNDFELVRFLQHLAQSTRLNHGNPLTRFASHVPSSLSIALGCMEFGCTDDLRDENSIDSPFRKWWDAIQSVVRKSAASVSYSVFFEVLECGLIPEPDNLMRFPVPTMLEDVTTYKWPQSEKNHSHLESIVGEVDWEGVGQTVTSMLSGVGHFLLLTVTGWIEERQKKIKDRDMEESWSIPSHNEVCPTINCSPTVSTTLEIVSSPERVVTFGDTELAMKQISAEERFSAFSTEAVQRHGGTFSIEEFTVTSSMPSQEPKEQETSPERNDTSFVDVVPVETDEESCIEMLCGVWSCETSLQDRIDELLDTSKIGSFRFESITSWIKLMDDCTKVFCCEPSLLEIGAESERSGYESTQRLAARSMVLRIDRCLRDLIVLIKSAVQEMKDHENFWCIIPGHFLNLGKAKSKGIESLHIFELVLRLKLAFPKQLIVLRGMSESPPARCVGFDAIYGSARSASMERAAAAVMDLFPLMVLNHDQQGIVYGGCITKEIVDRLESIRSFPKPYVNTIWSEDSEGIIDRHIESSIVQTTPMSRRDSIEIAIILRRQSQILWFYEGGTKRLRLTANPAKSFKTYAFVAESTEEMTSPAASFLEQPESGSLKVPTELGAPSSSVKIYYIIENEDLSVQQNEDLAPIEDEIIEMLLQTVAR